MRTFVKNKEFPMLQLNTGEDNPLGDLAFVLILANDSIYSDKDMSDLKKGSFSSCVCCGSNSRCFSRLLFL